MNYNYLGCHEWEGLNRGPEDRGPGTGDQGPGTGDQGPGTEDRGPGTGDQGPRTRTRYWTHSSAWEAVGPT